MADQEVADPDAPAAEEEQEELGVAKLESWVWYGEDPPPSGDVKERLNAIVRWGVNFGDFADYVQPLSQNQKIKKQGQPDRYETAWTLYFTVAGRVAMLQAAQEAKNWSVQFVPEPTTPTGIPGYLRMDEDRIVYREICLIHAPGRTSGGLTHGDQVLLGSRPGTAWVTGTGGAQAVASNRYEKVETSARGRALGAWGFGVLPGSGMASLEEMLSSRENAQAPSRSRAQARPAPVQKPRPEAEQELRDVMLEFQNVTGIDDDAMDNRVVQFVSRNMSIMLDRDDQSKLDFTPLKDGQIAILTKKMRKEVATARAEAPIE